MFRFSTGLFLLGVVSFVAAADPPAPTDFQTVVSSVNQFSKVLFHATLKRNANQNIITTIDSAINLAMVAHGAEGDTRKEVETSLKLPATKNATKDGFKSLLDSLAGMNMTRVNKIFIKQKKGVELKPDFKETVTQSFKSEFQYVSFDNLTVDADTMNKWCMNKTNNKIQDIVVAGNLQDSSLVLLSAYYFKGTWARQFNATLTKNESFIINENKTVNVPMMFARDVFTGNNMLNGAARWIKLPYTNNASMYIILPKRKNTLESIEKQIENVDFTSLDEAIDDYELHLPKFTISTRTELKEIAKSVGIKKMFDNTANFKSIHDGDLMVTQAMEKAMIEVDETGDKALAEKTASDDETLVFFKVNKPFICAVVLDGMKMPLFYARIVDPTKPIQDIEIPAPKLPNSPTTPVPNSNNATTVKPPSSTTVAAATTGTEADKDNKKTGGAFSHSSGNYVLMIVSSTIMLKLSTLIL